MKNIFLRLSIVCALITYALPQHADALSVRLQCPIYAGKGYIGLGAYHSATPYIFYAQNTTPGNDAWWDIKNVDGYYTICNTATGQYLSFTYDRDPLYYKYLILSDEYNGETELWEFEKINDSQFIINSVSDDTYSINLRVDGTYLVGCYQNYGSHGANEYITLYTKAGDIVTDVENGTTITPDPIPEPTPEPTPEPEPDKTLPIAVDMNEPMVFVHKTDGVVEGIPTRFLTEGYDLTARPLTLETTYGITLTYEAREIMFLTEECTTEFPYFTSFKFNNKFNDQMFSDPEEDGIISEDYSTIQCNGVAQIGRWLTPSFQLSDRDTDRKGEVYVNGVRQESKETRLCFARPVQYIISLPNYYYITFRPTDEESYELVKLPYGRQTTVTVDFLADQAIAELRVPTVYINSTDEWNRSDLDHNKETYREATIRIDGAGLYPDMPETAVNIKGRGNSSWSPGGNRPNPYRLKFETKQRPFGMSKGKSWALLANSIVPKSKMTNALGMKAAGMVGSASYNHIIPFRLIFDGEDRGNYNFTEKIGFSNNSVDIVDESAAVLYEMDTSSTDTYHATIYTSLAYAGRINANIKDPDFGDEETMQSIVITEDDAKQAIRDYVAVVERNNDDFAAMTDLKALARFLLVNELVFNCELAHPKSTYLYNENILSPDSMWIFGPVWDLDWAWGRDNGNIFKEPTRNYIVEGLRPGRGDQAIGDFWKVLRYQSEDMKREYYRVWKYLYEHTQELLDYADDYYAFAKPSLYNVYPDYTDYRTIKESMKEWLRTRIQYVYLNHIDHFDDEEEPPTPTVKYILGDANNDKYVDIADVTTIVSHILGQKVDDFDRLAADVNTDGTISVTDVLTLVQLILQQDVAYTSYQTPVAEASVRLGGFDIFGDVGTLPASLHIEEDAAYRDLQFDLLLPEGLELAAINLGENLRGYSVRFAEHEDGLWRVIMHHTGAQPLGAADYDFDMVLTADPQADFALRSATERRITTRNILISTPLGEHERIGSRTVIFGTNSTNAVGHATTNAETTETYDLQGRRLQPAQGQLYIQSGKVLLR